MPNIQSIVFYDKEKAENIWDNISKELYTRLFNYIIEKINENFEKNNKDINKEYQITILDFFGFGNFENDNSLEQLCINYANERLLQYFNNEIFKLELKIYEAEGIHFDKIEYIDNIETINLIDNKKGSIFSYLKDSFKQPSENSKDQYFRQTVYNNLLFKSMKTKNCLKPIVENHILKYVQKEKNSIYIKHYAGIVKYNVKDMVKNNISYFNNDIKSLLINSKNKLVKKLFVEEKMKKWISLLLKL